MINNTAARVMFELISGHCTGLIHGDEKSIERANKIMAMAYKGDVECTLTYTLLISGKL
jgi:hypothetical protein